MNLTPHDRELLRQRMDACRIGSDDLSLPEMSELSAALRTDPALRGEWESRQRSERLIAAAMDDLPVPAGLADRILAAAAASDRSRLAETTGQAVATVGNANADVEVQPAKRPALLTRRQWSWIGGAALLLAAAVVIQRTFFAPPTPVTKEQLVASAQDWFKAAVMRRGDPQPGQAPIAFPQAALSLSPQAWRAMPTAEERSLVAFDLTKVQMGGPVFLFAAQTNKKYDVRSVPYTKLSATGGLEIGAWQQGDVLYVVVIDQGSGRRLQDVLHSANLAWVSPRRDLHAK
jgi:hypothetical protein